MRIRVITTFIDRQATDPDKAEVAAGSNMTVSAERGAELIQLGLAIDATSMHDSKDAEAGAAESTTPNTKK